MDSVLTSIKKLLGLEEEYTQFDTDITIHINSVLFRLETLGLTPTSITDKTQTWTDILAGRTDLESIKTYIYLKVRLIFDPPQTSFVIDTYERQIKELEWLINEQIGGDLDE